jgi:hypothetical protein
MKYSVAAKTLLGEIPLTAELYWQFRQQGKPLSKSFSLQRVQKHLPEWIDTVKRQLNNAEQNVRRVEIDPNALTRGASQNDTLGRKILMFTTLRYWIEHSVLLSLALTGQGHQVALAYLPVNNWRVQMNRFDLRRQNAYAHSVLRPLENLVQPISILDIKKSNQPLPPVLAEAIQEVSMRDVQYTLQIENVNTTDVLIRQGSGTTESELYRLRLERNTQAAQAALKIMQAKRPDVLLTPNGSILEMGAIYQAARSLDIPVVTYEFGEQRGRIWLAYNDEVMLQNTNELWQVWKDQPLTDSQLEQIRALYASRQNASLWENFSRRWQGLPSQGGEQVRQTLGLDDGFTQPRRPLAVLAANVIGDSLTLGRQVFSQNMTEWLQRTLRNFAQRPQAQLVVRIHPGERYTKGPSVADVIRTCLPELPENIRLVAASDPINTYDLVEIADLGLVYTTTVGMEMAMSGVPTIVTGHTHYRGKGFTLDPQDWEDYFEQINQVLQDPQKARLERAQVDLAWQYAYRFFFDYPLPFPWHMLYFFDELGEWNLEKVLSKEGQAVYGEALRSLGGEPRRWRQVAND